MSRKLSATLLTGETLGRYLKAESPQELTDQYWHTDQYFNSLSGKLTVPHQVAPSAIPFRSPSSGVSPDAGAICLGFPATRTPS